MNRTITITAFALAMSAAAPASSAFYLEGLKTFTQEPRCNDEYATDKRGCAKPDRAYPVPPKSAGAAPVSERHETREGLEKK